MSVERLLHQSHRLRRLQTWKNRRFPRKEQKKSFRHVRIFLFVAKFLPYKSVKSGMDKSVSPRTSAKPMSVHVALSAVAMVVFVCLIFFA